MIGILVLITIVACSYACGVLFYIGFLGCSSPIAGSNNENDKRK